MGRGLGLTESHKFSIIVSYDYLSIIEKYIFKCQFLKRDWRGVRGNHWFWRENYKLRNFMNCIAGFEEWGEVGCLTLRRASYFFYFFFKLNFYNGVWLLIYIFFFFSFINAKLGTLIIRWAVFLYYTFCYEREVLNV